MDTDAILERRRLRRRASFWRVTAFVVLAVALVAALIWASDVRGFNPAAVRGEVADIRVDGFIETTPKAVELLKKASEDASVRAILLHIDSPGGAASGGEALYRAVRDATEEKPVVAVIDGLGASAAYMAAIAADHVIARESSITGSIGVIFQFGHFEDLLGRLGIEYVEVKSAPLKGEPSLFKEPDPAALAMIQTLVNDSYQWFVDLVAERRQLAPDEARRLADGSVYTGRQALALKLIDALGSDEEARAWLAAEKGVSTELPLTEWKEREGIFSSFGANAWSGLTRLISLQLGLEPAAALLPRRLTVDGLLSVWQAPVSGRSDR